MGFTIGDMRKVLAAFEDSDWEEIHISSGDSELHLVAMGVVPSGQPLVRTTPVPTPTSTVASATPMTSARPVLADAPPAAAPVAGGLVIAAPSMGVFYRAPSPGAPPFVEVGDTVTPDTTVCIVEVMKLMNPIQAGHAGTVAAVHLANADRVVKDQALFTILPTG